MKQGITLYNNGAIGRIHNRRITLRERDEKKDSFLINFLYAIKDENPPNYIHHRGLSSTTIGLSREGALTLLQMLDRYFDREAKVK